MRVRTTGLAIILSALGTACGSNGGVPTVAGTGGSGGSGVGGNGGSDAGVIVELDLTVSPGAGRHAVSPLIYGVNGVKSAAAMKAKLVRFGGNDMPPYNWEINATNGGRLAGYENRAASGGDSPGAAPKQVLDQATQNGATAVVTIPIGDYVAADVKSGDVHQSGASYLLQRFDDNRASKGGPLYEQPDLTDNAVYQDEFVNWLKAQAGKTPVFLALDNQPGLWSEDHAEIHPQPTGYEELVTRNIKFAKAVRAVWANVPILGYVGYGWQSFEDLQNSPDAATKGQFVSYYLDQMHAAEGVNGQRLIDYLDVHWWPEVEGAGVRVISPNTDAQVAAARMSAPSELWDPDFRETSWIQDVLGDEGIRLIPRLKDEIAAHYPGTKLSFSAWYYGGGSDISGAIATADVLGIFGREGVNAAAIDLSGGDDSYTLAAFSAYLDYDGKGAHFGDTSVGATTNDRVGSSVYASTDAADPTRLVVIAINKRDIERPTTLTIDGKTAYKSCQVYALTSASSRLVTRAAPRALGDNTFSYTMPKTSLSVIIPKR